MRRIENLPVIIEKGEDGWWVAKCPVFDGCFTQGRTLREVKRNIIEAIELCIECGEEIKRYDEIEVSVPY